MSVNAIPDNSEMKALMYSKKADSVIQQAKPFSPSIDKASSQTSKIPKGNSLSERTMKHVVQVYNQDGKVRIKFMDSNNDVIYQLPSEMALKIKDQMSKQDTSAYVNV